MLFFVTGTKSRTCFPSERRSLIGQLHQFQIALSLSLMSLPLLLVSSDIRVLAASLVSSDICPCSQLGQFWHLSLLTARSVLTSVLAHSSVSSDICPCSRLGQFWQHTKGGNSIWRNYYSQVGGSSSEGDAQRIIPKMGAKRHLLSPWRSVGYTLVPGLLHYRFLGLNISKVMLRTGGISRFNIQYTDCTTTDCCLFDGCFLRKKFRSAGFFIDHCHVICWVPSIA